MFFSLMWFSGCRFSTAAIQPSSARQLPILAALNEENPTLSPPIITEPCALFNTFLRKILFAEKRCEQQTVRSANIIT